MEREEKYNNYHEQIHGWFDFDNIYSDMVKKAPANSHFVEIGVVAEIMRLVRIGMGHNDCNRGIIHAHAMYFQKNIRKFFLFKMLKKMRTIKFRYTVIGKRDAVIDIP